MKNKKIMGIIILVILLLLLGIFVIYPKFVKNDSYEKYYDKYPDMKWASLNSNTKGIEIVDNKLKCDDKYKFVCDLVKEPIKKFINWGNYDEQFSILTESGKVYVYDYNSEIHEMELKQILKDYKIIDITEEMKDYSMAYYYNVSFDTEWGNSSETSSLFYLTSDGSLINSHNKTYEEVNQDFNYSQCFVDVVWGSAFRNYMICLYFSEDNNVSYRESKRKENENYFNGNYGYSADYIKFKNKDNNPLKAKYIYDITHDEKRNKTLIVDENDDLYEIVFGNNKENAKLQYIGEIYNFTYVNESNSLKFKLSNDSEMDYVTDNSCYYDLENHSSICDYQI